MPWRSFVLKHSVTLTCDKGCLNPCAMEHSPGLAPGQEAPCPSRPLRARLAHAMSLTRAMIDATPDSPDLRKNKALPTSMETDIDATEGGLTLIESGRCAMAQQWIRMPSSGLREKTPKGLRNIPCALLLRCRNGTVWFLTSSDQAWSDERIDGAAAFLALHGDRWSRAMLQNGLADAIEMPVRIEDLCLARLDGGFKVAALADGLLRAWLARQVSTVDVAQARAHRSKLETLGTQQLRAYVPIFQGGLDQAVLHLMESQRLHESHYNYLAHSELGRNRLQFAAQLPLLLPHLILPSNPASLWSQLRDAVDGGRSWLTVLTKGLGISTSAVNSLRGVRPCDLDAHWASNPQQLLEILDAIAPEHRPTTAEHWTTLTEEFKLTQKLFGIRGAQHAAVGARLRHVMKMVVGKGRNAAALDPAEVLQIDQLRDGLHRALIAHLIQDGESRSDIATRSLITSKLNQQLAKLSWSRLLSLSRKWRLEYAGAVQHEAEAIGFLLGADYWNYIPDTQEFEAGNGIVVQCLCRRQLLVEHGKALENCLAGSHLAYYHDACLAGGVIVVALLDQPTRKPLSSVEFAIITSLRDGKVCLELVQHTGYRNARPTSPQTVALHSFLSEFATPRWQEHAKAGLRAVRRRRLLAEMEKGKADPAMAVVAGRALLATLGQNWLAQFHHFTENTSPSG